MDAYTVNYRIKMGEFWKKDSKVYLAKGKGAHRKIEKQFYNDFKGFEVQLVNITYQ